MPTRGRRKNKRVRVKGETHPLAASADRATPARRRKQQEREIRGIGFLLWVMITAWKYGLKGVKCICHGNYYIKAP